MSSKNDLESKVREIRRKTRRKFTAEERDEVSPIHLVTDWRRMLMR